MTVICGICGASFIPRGPRRLNCSAECTKQHKKNLRTVHKKENPDAHRAWNRDYYKRKTAKEQTEKDRQKAERAITKAITKAKQEAARKAEQCLRMRERRQELARCIDCKEQKPREFKRRKNGTLNNRRCRKCQSKENKAYLQSRPEGIKEYRKIVYNRIKADPVLHLKVCIRQRIHKAIKRSASALPVKPGKIRYLGCSAEQAKAYLEQQFKGCMTWDNYGKAWHVDHVIPVASFDLTTEEGRSAAFHYTNIQPLWAKTNMRKNARMPNKPHQPMLLAPPCGSFPASVTEWPHWAKARQYSDSRNATH